MSAAEKVDILRQIYEGFFDAAMKDTVKRLGIVYTPVPLVDFILRSADAVCRQEFGYGLSSPNVHVLDPFAGTGTFFYRLLTLKGADGEYLIRDEDLLRKYRDELHANEIVLLAYYIAALKIEAGMAERNGFQDQTYEEFSGIVLQDSMLTADRSGQLSGFTPMRENSERAERQTELPIRVIVTNPPWSAGEKSAGDRTAPLEYPEVESRVRETYGSYRVKGRSGGKALGNLFVQAMRWMSDRLTGDQPGIIAFVHPNSLANAQSLAVARAALRDEFSSIYVVNLRGNAYTSGEEFRREGDKVFGGGSRNGVQVTLLVKNPQQGQAGVVRYSEVPEAQKLEAKLEWLSDLGTVANHKAFAEIPIDASHDWVDLTDGSFAELLPVCSAAKGLESETACVNQHALGVATNMDAYAYSFGRVELEGRMRRLIVAYNRSVSNGQMDLDNTDIKWTDRLKQQFRRGTRLEFDESRIRPVMYRPFVKLWLYEDDRILTSVRSAAAMFPRDGASEIGGGSILITAPSNQTVFGVLAISELPDLHSLGPGIAARVATRRRS